MLMELTIATGCEVARDQCRFSGKRAGCQGACVQLAWTVCVRSGCSGACGQIVGEDELVHDACGVQAIVDAACVLNGVMYVSPLQNSFAETRGAMLLVSMHVSWFVMNVPNCGAMMCCSRRCDVGVTCGVLCV